MPHTPHPDDPDRIVVLDALFQLTAALYQPPRAPLRKDLESGTFSGLIGMVAEALDLPAPALKGLDYAEVETRYVELFVSHTAGIPAPPYAGYALDGALLDLSVRALRDFFERTGFTIREGWGDLPDHIAALAEAGLLLLDRGRDDHALELAGRFLLPWFERYTPVLVAADPHGLYGPMTRFVGRALSRVLEEVTHGVEA